MPSSPQPPPAVEDLARQRQQAREARDYPLADLLRGQIVAAGWDVVDTAGGYTLAPRQAPVETFPSYAAVPTRYPEADACTHSLCLAFHGWPEDVERLLASVMASAGGRVGEIEVVIAVVAGEPGAALSGFSHPALSRPPVLVRVGDNLGHGEALAIAGRRARGRLLHFVEPSLEFGWQVLDAAGAVLGDASVGATGPFGLTTADWREFHPAPAGDVLALEYLLSIRRADVPRIGEMDPAYRFYRNLDLDYSRQVAAAGLTIRSFDAEVTRHAHRLWEATAAADRDRLSRRNFNRLLDRWVRPGAPSS